MAETWAVQTIIVRKGDGVDNVEDARKIAKRHGATKTEVDETDSSYRFRQREPGEFKPRSFRTREEGDKVAVVSGILKE